MKSYAIVDLFAGPGGLGEGFSAKGKEPNAVEMKIHLSIEKEPTEVSTLRLRSFLRDFDKELPRQYYIALQTGSNLPNWEKIGFERQWKKATDEVRQLTLGEEGAFESIKSKLDSIREDFHGDTILIGGPPCQAYSLVGRARNRGKLNYIPELDHRHFLYREYVKILQHLRPAVFVMENVKGMLSSKVDGGDIFQRIMEDLANSGDGYNLLPLSAPISSNTKANDFIVCSEDFGIPQARHRVFIVGVRNDLSSPTAGTVLMKRNQVDISVGVLDVIKDLPKIRSGLSKGDSLSAWRHEIINGLKNLTKFAELDSDILAVFKSLESEFIHSTLMRSDNEISGFLEPSNVAIKNLKQWLIDPNLGCVTQHETRGHIPEDLIRYVYASTYALTKRKSPKLLDFPYEILPKHKNRLSNNFVDRFRVQLGFKPASTITSHISKDGHYFIHPDPSQARSLTVREAARLQTFPDNYYFCGPRTKQFHQVGNAVPPFLAYQIAGAISNLLKNQ